MGEIPENLTEVATDAVVRRTISAAIPPGSARGRPYKSNRACRAGAIGGARTASPRHLSIARATFGWVIAEITSLFPPHFGHLRTSSWKTRIIRFAQVSLLSRRPGGSLSVSSEIGTLASKEWLFALLRGWLLNFYH